MTSSGQPILRLLALLGWCWLVGCGDTRTESTCGPLEVIVTRVVDGDTVAVRPATGEPTSETHDELTVRYLYIDTPELSPVDAPECFAAEALQLNQSLTLGKRLRLEYPESCTDRYDRLLAIAFRGDVMVNAVMVERGYARLLLLPEDSIWTPRLLAAERSAKERRAGLWAYCEVATGPA